MNGEDLLPRGDPRSITSVW